MVYGNEKQCAEKMAFTSRNCTNFMSYYNDCISIQAASKILGCARIPRKYVVYFEYGCDRIHTSCYSLESISWAGIYRIVCRVLICIGDLLPLLYLNSYSYIFHSTQCLFFYTFTSPRYNCGFAMLRIQQLLVCTSLGFALVHYWALSRFLTEGLLEPVTLGVHWLRRISTCGTFVTISGGWYKPWNWSSTISVKLRGQSTPYHPAVSRNFCWGCSKNSLQIRTTG